jgi:hypothetical protein
MVSSLSHRKHCNIASLRVADIFREDMYEMFDFCVRRTYELLMQQWQRARENQVAIQVCIRRCHSEPLIHVDTGKALAN